VSLILVLGAALAAMPAAAAPDQAAGTALMQCVAHAAGPGTISPDHAALLARSGLEYQAEPPAALRSMFDTPYGHATFARSPATEGQIWAVGYDRGTCMVKAIGTAPEAVENRLGAMFAIPGGWRAEPVKQPDAVSRWTQYGMDANGRHLTAQMKVQPMPATPVKGLVMVTVSASKKK
jgi:hypothetical protein